jgi:hypothetical protein
VATRQALLRGKTKGERNEGMTANYRTRLKEARGGFLDFHEIFARRPPSPQEIQPGGGWAAGSMTSVTSLEKPLRKFAGSSAVSAA